ncbi:putative IRON-SULFUR-BINDING REDUCTASE domain protein [Mycobacterium xenopi 4042]|uniref:Putative IRON-SULFUR-BINDING REDUCTASE domain protein n=1 Tax=Mycobacterium xenopi 4042 TaxID=1299334 RepID=X7Z9B2_MYCXE|nr:putative IRON-SULFUR-BINDING REDUCTASE domain protein [Mycobacterium xenopi 4042]
MDGRTHRQADQPRARRRGAGHRATTVATACPFCRVMVSDGVDDRAEAAGRADVDVRDVANLLLESIDRSAVTLPARARPPSRPPGRSQGPASPSAPAAPAEATAEPAAETAAPTQQKPTKAVTGLGIAGAPSGREPKRQLPNTTRGRPQPDAKTEAAQAKPAPTPAKGLGIAAGAKRPGAKKARLRVLHLSRNRNPNPRLPTRTVTGNLRRRP